MATAGGGGSIFGYVGEANDATGLIFLRARYYSPTLGRFFTRDPWAGNAQAPGTLHPYLYGLNNPLRYKDPSGRACQDYDMAGHIITVCNNKPEWDTIVYGAQSVSSYPQQYVQGKPSVDSTSTSNAAPSQSNRPKSTETPRLYQPTLTPGPQVCSNFAPGTDPECSPMNWGSDSADLMLKAMGVEFDLAENALGVKIPLISIVPDVLSQVHKDEDKGYSSVQMAFRAAVAASEGQITSITSAVAGTSAFIATVDNPFFAIGAYISVSVSMSELFDKVNEGSIFPYLKKLENNQH
jgi:RHS repeat-associated protein